MARAHATSFPSRETIDLNRPSNANWAREELLSLLSVSATLAGLCITVVAFMNSVDKARSTVTVVDEILASTAAAFLLCVYLIFWALRTYRPSLSTMLVRIVDAVFLLALTSMTVSAFVMVYTLW